MKLLKLNPQKSKAQAIVEFAIVLPILLLVVYGLIETGRLLFIYSSVNNATRQAARYGSTSGEGPNGVPRFQDCAEIRAAAQKSDFLDAFDDAAITISYDNGPGTTSYDTCDGAADGGVTPSQGDRVVVSIDAEYNTIVPNLVPFLARTVANGNPIVAESSRTLLLTISIAPPKENTVTLITSDIDDPSEIGQYVSVSVTVTANTTPTGTVTITGADENCSINLSGGSGSCNVRFLSIGTKILTATYVGDSTHNPSGDTESHTVIKASTITTITADTPDPSLVNQAVNVTVTVTSLWGTPTGTVTITGADTNCIIDLSTTNNCNVNFASSGPKLLTATYGGDSEHETSDDTETHDVILPGATVTEITLDTPDPSLIGQAVTVNVTVSGSTTPTGTVAITGADTNCSFTLVNGAGSCNTVSFSTLGSKTLTATYTPDTSSHTGSSDTENHSVALPATTTTITAAQPYFSGQNISVTVNVANVPGGSAITPTGTVIVTGQDLGCTTPVTLVNGAGSCTVVFSTTGSKTLTAVYSGDSGHAGSTGTLTITVTTPAITGCNTVTVGLLKQTNGAMTMTINNPLTEFLQISNVTITWNHDKGHQSTPHEIRLQSVSLGSVFWTGDQAGPTYTITPALPIFIPPGPSTLVFNFNQAFDRWDNTEQVTINLSTPGCEGVILFQNQH